VLVDSGATLVMGGVYTSREAVEESGFPVLRHIPIVGWFFGNKTKTLDRGELFVFITPRILNEREAGLVAGSGG
jgi:type II secretory pathway component GspD/PulD (secretin)